MMPKRVFKGRDMLLDKSLPNASDNATDIMLNAARMIVRWENMV